MRTASAAPRNVKIFVLDLWVPADKPRYKLQMRVTGYQGSGEFSSAANGRSPVAFAASA